MQFPVLEQSQENQIMKWFKHLSKSRNDALLRDAVSLFGLAGEHVFWRTLELLSDEFEVKTPGYGNFLIKSWSKNYETSVQKTIKILRFFTQKKVIFVKVYGKGRTRGIKINCPKLKVLCDNWTQKMVKKTRKSLRSKDEVTFQQEEEERRKKKEEEHKRLSALKENAVGNNGFYMTKKKRRLGGKRLETFNEFWEIFNYKKAKAEAADSWIDIPHLTDAIFEKIKVSAKAEADNRSQLISDGKTPKWAQGWITGRRWEDEIIGSGESNERDDFLRQHGATK